jgi:long-chain acyl-CoA synthetase
MRKLAHNLVLMEFWKLDPSNAATAAIDGSTGKQWSYAQLAEDTARMQSALPRLGRKTLGLLLARNRYECLAVYLAALNAGSALVILDATVNASLLIDFLEVYRPDWVFTTQLKSDLPGYRNSSSGEPGMLEIDRPRDIDIHPNLALLLSTSGSTGSPKLVRLSLRNLQANADSIAQYLRLTSQDRPITSLPMSYSYGLSVINSHLHARATVVFTESTVLRREFWEAVERHACNSFAGVPYTYQMLLQTGLLNRVGASLNLLTQAGGMLPEQYVRQMHSLALRRGWKFFVMYGQTEAAPRISYVPFEQLGRKIGSIGIAVPDGSLTTDAETGELIYSGPNVMLGYAECRQDLAKSDELGGVLRTGDLARQDTDGYFYITGRMKRFLKLFGKRFNLDDVERILSHRIESGIACYGRDDLLMLAVEQCRNSEALGETVCDIFDLPRTAVKVVSMQELPRTRNGKLDYRRLTDANLEPTPGVTR